MKQLILMACLVCLAAVLSPAPALAGPTLDQVRANGAVRCGVSDGLPGFSSKDETGRWQGFNVDLCRAVAAAALGQADKVDFVPVTSSSRFPLLLANKIDVLMRNTTETFEREAALGVEFTGIYYYDEQAFLVRRASGFRHLTDLNGATICLAKRTTHEVNLKDYFHPRGWTYTPLLVETLAEMQAAFFGGQCQVLTSDRSQLAALRQLAPDGAETYDILPETISREPLGPVVRRGDDEWLTLVKWVLLALIEAEARGVTQANVHTLLESSPDPGTRRFLASDGLPEKALQLNSGWVVRVIAAVGNYGEIFDRHLGAHSELKLERGLNRLWTQGGLLYSPPFR
jgi:general L-amino acid transport system substrate-binding protein